MIQFIKSKIKPPSSVSTHECSECGVITASEKFINHNGNYISIPIKYTQCFCTEDDDGIESGKNEKENKEKLL